MGTKLNPGPHDCLARALPDEHYFVLLARDPLAGFLVSIWSKLRMGADLEAAEAVFRRMSDVAIGNYWASPDIEKAAEAIDCAMAMFAWRKNNDGRWRAPHRPLPHHGELTLSRDEHEAIHTKLDQLLEGQQTIMSQQSDLHDALAAISGDVDTLKQHATDLEGQLAAKANDLNVDLSAELTLAQTIKAKLEGVSSAMPAPTLATGDDTGGAAPAATDAAVDQTQA